MAFPTSPADGDIYTDPTTNRKFIYSAANSLWRMKGRSELADYSNLTGTIASPSPGDSLVASANGVDYEPAPQVSNNFQARKESTSFNTNWQGSIDYPAGALGLVGGGQDMVVHVSTSPRSSYAQAATNYSNGTPGSSGATYTFAPGAAFCFSFTIKEPISTGSLYYLALFGVLPDATYPTSYLGARCAVLKGREIDQSALDAALNYQTDDRVLTLSATRVYNYSNINLFFYNASDYAHQFSVGDTLTCIVWCETSSTSATPLTIDDWTGIAPTSVTGWQQVNTVISPGLVFPAGYTGLTDLSTTGDLPIYARFNTTYEQSRDTRKPITSFYDLYERRKNQVPDDQNLEILSAPVTPSQSQFLVDKYTIYNSTTGALNYWDSGTSSWIAI